LKIGHLLQQAPIKEASGFLGIGQEQMEPKKDKHPVNQVGDVPYLFSKQ